MTRAPALLGVLLLAASPALAAEGVQWVPSFEEARKQAKDRGSMIFVGMVLDNEPANDAQKAAYQDPGFVKMSRNFVCVYANPMVTHGQTQVEVDGEKVERCREAPAIRCEDHVACYNKILENYANLNTSSAGDTRFPFQFVTDADGNVLQTIANGDKESGFDTVDAGTMVSVLKSLVSKHGKGISADEYAQLTAKLDEGRGEAEKRSFKKALKLLDEVIETGGKSSLADQAREEKEKIVVAGREAIEKAAAGAADDPAGAVVALEQIQDDFAGTDVSKEAKSRIADLKKDPEVKKALSQIADRKAAEKLLARAEEEIGKKQYAKGLALLDEIVEKYPDLPQAGKAKARADELRADEAIKAEVREQEAGKDCKRWLSMGRSFAKNGMIDKARAEFERIIEKYPGTSFAAEAEKELEKLEGK